MYKANNYKIFPMILIAVVIIALVAGAVTLGRYLLGGNNRQAEQAKSEQQVARDQLLKVNRQRSVRMTVRGAIVADEEFRSYRITISPQSRQYQMFKGYLGDELVNKSYGNNTKAYDEFVHALDKAAMTKRGKYSDKQAGDLRGVCATGKVYEFEVLNGKDVLKHYWTSTCKGSPGTFGASVQQVGSLFRTQIPDREIDLGASATRLQF